MKNNCIIKTKQFIEEHFTENITLDDISKSIGYSKYHLNRIFLKSTGKTIYQYIKERRLFEAANQLLNTDKSIVEIALDVGYTSQQSFTLAFKSVFKCTPKVYRNQNIIYVYQKNLFIYSNDNSNRYNISLLRRKMVA